jgi:phosphoglycolate phosphatase-like HAD superfamily hydrolase
MAAVYPGVGYGLRRRAASLAAVQVLALDFDGVISDSAPEAFLVALRAWVALRPDTAFSADLAALERASGGIDRDVVTASRLYPDFLQAMPLGNRAEDYGIELAALEARAALRDQLDYDAFRRDLERRDPGFTEAFHERFYRERSGFAAGDPAGWRRLIGPYPEFIAILRRRATDRVLAIATAKDIASVARLLEDYGIRDLFPAERVLDKETGRSKRAHLEQLHERTGSPFERIAFVDDKVNHLESVASLGVRCVLAAWGYNGPREHERARARGFVVCSLGEAEHVLFDPGGLP